MQLNRRELVCQLEVVSSFLSVKLQDEEEIYHPETRVKTPVKCDITSTVISNGMFGIVEKGADRLRDSGENVLGFFGAW